jgi:glyoxylase-like metal-dependent hydrolase (beta-lactamase superfamily II)
LSCIRILIVTTLCLTCGHMLGQFGPQESQGHGPKLPAPTSFPAPGTYPTTESVTLRDTEPGVTIHYTWDGSAPNSKSPVYDPLQVLFIGGIYEGDHGLKAGYTLRAIAIKDGNTNSDIANFEFIVDRRDRTVYVSEEILPGVRMVRDSDNDKMFLVKGSEKYALIDCGQGRGALRDYVMQFTGGLPIEPIFTHNHGDHIGQADQFIRDSVEHIGEADRSAVERLLKSRNVPDEVIAQHLLAIHEGDRVDLGDRSLVIYETPGHTRGSIVIFDEKNGYLFSGDSYGSNSPTIPDALWMQGSQVPLDMYLSMIVSSRAHFAGQVKYMMTGHNDRPLSGETYLNNLQSSIQSLMDKGDAALVPSYRPVGLEQVVVGDRYSDPDWVAVNVNKNHYLPAPIDDIAGLTSLRVEGGKLSPAFDPNQKTYEVSLSASKGPAHLTAVPTSSRSSALTANGKDFLKVGVVDVPAQGVAAVTVVSPNGKQSATYIVTFPKDPHSNDRAGVSALQDQ